MKKLNDPKEAFLITSTLGKLLNLTLPDLDDQDEPLERKNGLLFLRPLNLVDIDGVSTDNSISEQLIQADS